MRVVTPRSLPADLPKSAIPGIMKPTMIRGIVKPKKLPKIELNVAKILTILGKLRFPITIPKIIPRIRRGSKRVSSCEMPPLCCWTLSAFYSRIRIVPYRLKKRKLISLFEKNYCIMKRKFVIFYKYWQHGQFKRAKKIKGEKKKGKNFSLIKRKTVGDGKANLYSKTGNRTA